MTEKTISRDSYNLSSDEKDDIIKDSIDDMSDTLSGYQMNSKMEQAWISKIVPPESDENIDIYTNADQIAVQFLLPSDDVFWETFNYPDMRWPEDNEFRNFMENIGFRDPSDIPNMIGECVDVEYDESVDKWVTDVEPEPEVSEKIKQKIYNVDVKENFKMLFSYVIIGFAVLACVFLLVIFKHLAIVPVIAISFIIYTFYDMNSNIMSK